MLIFEGLRSPSLGDRSKDDLMGDRSIDDLPREEPDSTSRDNLEILPPSLDKDVGVVGVLLYAISDEECLRIRKSPLGMN